MKTAILAAGAGVLLVSMSTAQTQIDLMQQSRNVDFSKASKTKPVRTGAAMPGICEIGELFFKTTAASGKNLYMCVATNIWVPIEASITSVFGRVGSVQPAEGDYALTHLSDVDGKHGSASAVQMFGGGDALPGHCATFDASGNLISAGAPCGEVSSMKAGGGLMMTGTSPTTISVNTAAVPTFLTAKVGITGFAVPAFSCVERTMSLPGAGLDDAVAAGWPADVPSGVTGTMRVTGTGVVAPRVCNITSSEINMPAANYRATVVRSF